MVLVGLSFAEVDGIIKFSGTSKARRWDPIACFKFERK